MDAYTFIQIKARLAHYEDMLYSRRQVGVSISFLSWLEKLSRKGKRRDGAEGLISYPNGTEKNNDAKQFGAA